MAKQIIRPMIMGTNTNMKLPSILIAKGVLSCQHLALILRAQIHDESVEKENCRFGWAAKVVVQRV